MLDNKALYRQLCEEQGDNIPLFLQAWWLDAATEPDGKHWDVVLSFDGQNKIQAALPFVCGKRFGIRYALQPQLTPIAGIWHADGLSARKKLEVDEDIIHLLKDMRIDLFEQTFHPEFDNWSAFCWNGFEQTTRYTYQIKNLQDLDSVFSNISESKQRRIKRGEKTLHTVEDISFEQLFELKRLQVEHKGQKLTYNYQLLKSLYEAATTRNHCLTLGICDDEQELHAACMIVFDSRVAYYLICSFNPKYNKSDAPAMLIWEAIKRVAKLSKVFDFEGSMIRSIAENYSLYGSVAQPLLKLTYSNSIIKLARTICNK